MFLQGCASGTHARRSCIVAPPSSHTRPLLCFVLPLPPLQVCASDVTMEVDDAVVRAPTPTPVTPGWRAHAAAALRAQVAAAAQRDGACIAVCDRAARLPSARRNGSVRAREEAKTPTFPAPEHARQLGVFVFEGAHTRLVAAGDGSGGVEYVEAGIRRREEAVLADLVAHGHITEDVLRGVIAINSGTAELPKRVADFALTNFSKRQHSICTSARTDGGFAYNDAYEDYNSTIKKYNRLLFDVFCRGTYLFFNLEGAMHTTTVAQLIFVLQQRALKTQDFFHDNLAAIRTHYDETLAQGRAKRAQATPHTTSSTSHDEGLAPSPRVVHAEAADVVDHEVEEPPPLRTHRSGDEGGATTMSLDTWTWATPLRRGGSDVSLEEALHSAVAVDDAASDAGVRSGRAGDLSDDGVWSRLQPCRAKAAPGRDALHSDAPCEFDDINVHLPSWAMNVSPLQAAFSSPTLLPRRRTRTEASVAWAEEPSGGGRGSSGSSSSSAPRRLDDDGSSAPTSRTSRSHGTADTTSGVISGPRRHELTRIKTKQTCGSVSGAFAPPLELESKLAAQWARTRAPPPHASASSLHASSSHDMTT